MTFQEALAELRPFYPRASIHHGYVYVWLYLNDTARTKLEVERGEVADHRVWQAIHRAVTGQSEPAPPRVRPAAVRIPGDNWRASVRHREKSAWGRAMERR